VTIQLPSASCDSASSRLSGRTTIAWSGVVSAVAAPLSATRPSSFEVSPDKIAGGSARIAMMRSWSRSHG
jgi:hypothetical protein